MMILLPTMYVTKQTIGMSTVENDKCWKISIVIGKYRLSRCITEY